MKKYLIPVIIALGMSLSSCEKWLDVPLKTRIKADELFQSEAGFKDALRGIYIGMTSEALFGRELTFGFFEVLVGNYNLIWGNNTYYMDVSAGRLMNDNVRVHIDRMWLGLYNLIARTNLLLENLETNGNILTGNNYYIMKGEALGLRAFLHLQVFKIFGDPTDLDSIAMPYVTVIGTTPTPSSTGHEFLSLVRNDLNRALVYLTKDPIYTARNKRHSDPFLNGRELRMNYYAVHSVYARAALWAGDNARALERARYVMAAADAVFPWVLLDNLTTPDERNVDRTFSTEHIFALNVHNLGNIYLDWLSPSTPALRALVMATWNFDNWFQAAQGNVGANDYRVVYLTSVENFNPGGNQRVMTKFRQPVGYNPEFAARMPLIRRTEMYYIVAEVLAARGEIAEATEYLNRVRARRGLSLFPLEDLTEAQFETELMREYLKEFWGEGHLFFYAKRRNLQANPFNRWLEGGLQLNTVYVMPRPEAEIEFGR
jgi:hypothetical protein